MKQGWEIKKLGEVCNLYQPKTISGEMLIEDGKYLVYGANGVIGRYNQYNHENSEVLLTCRGATCGTINMSAPYSWINGNAMVVQPKTDSITKQFLALYLQSVDWKNVITGAAQPQITRQSLSPLTIEVPPREEQERIVAELDCLSGVIEKKREQLEELDALAQSIFYQMFGDPITNEKGWEVKTIGDVCKLKSGDSSANNTSEGALPYIKVGDMNMSENVPYITTSSTLVSREENIKGIFPIGTTIFPKRGGAIFTNKKRLTTVEICCDLKTMGVIPMHEVLPLYIFHFFIQIDFGELCNGAAIPQINNIDIAPLKICVPPLTLQQEFADKIEAIEKQKELIKESIKETETLFNARMDYYFNS